MIESVRDRMLVMARWYQARYEYCMKSWSGADRPDGELHRREAEACRRLARGEDVETVLSELQKGWEDFADENNRRVEAGFRMKYGPSAGLYAMHYKYADPNRGMYSDCYIRHIYNDALGDVFCDERLGRDEQQEAQPTEA
jgi:hypothetical protein